MNVGLAGNNGESKTYLRLSYLEYYSDSMHPFYRHPLFGIVSRMRVQWIIRKLSGLGKKVVLDAGCAAGFFSLRFAEAGFAVVPFDVCRDAVADFSRKLRSTAFGNVMQPSVADVYHIPFKARTVDAVVCSEVIQFLPSLDEVMCEFGRVLKEDGVLVVSFGNQRKRRIFYPLLRFMGLNPDVIEKTFPHEHDMRGVVSSVKGLFSLEDVMHVPSRLFPLSTIVFFRKNK